MTTNDGIELLRSKIAEYGRGGNARAALELGISKGAVSDVLNGKYRGNVAKIAELAVARYYVVTCPILGEIEAPRCHAERQRPFSTANSLRVRLYHACRQCESRGDRHHGTEDP